MLAIENAMEIISCPEYICSEVERRLFSFNRKAPIDSYKNPLLMAGDLIRIRNSLLSAATEVLKEVSAPAVGVYSLYNLFQPNR